MKKLEFLFSLLLSLLSFNTSAVDTCSTQEISNNILQMGQKKSEFQQRCKSRWELVNCQESLTILVNKGKSKKSLLSYFKKNKNTERKEMKKNLKTITQALASQSKDMERNCHNADISSAIIQLVEKMESQNCHKEEGIFRVPGKKAVYQPMVEKSLTTGLGRLEAEELSCHNLASTVKHLLKKNTEPMQHGDIVYRLMNLLKNEHKPLALKTIFNQNIKLIFDYSWPGIVKLIQYLQRVDQNAEVNKMNAKNLSIAIGPSFLTLSAEQESLLRKRLYNEDVSSQVSAFSFILEYLLSSKANYEISNGEEKSFWP